MQGSYKGPLSPVLMVELRRVELRSFGAGGVSLVELNSGLLIMPADVSAKMVSASVLPSRPLPSEYKSVIGIASVISMSSCVFVPRE